MSQPPKPVSCRVFRYFTPAAARLSNAVSVSTDSYGVGLLDALKNILTMIDIIDINFVLLFLALESPFYSKTDKSTYWDQCFEHLECLGRGSFAEVNSFANVSLRDCFMKITEHVNLCKFQGL